MAEEKPEPETAEPVEQQPEPPEPQPVDPAVVALEAAVDDAWTEDGVDTVVLKKELEARGWLYLGKISPNDG